MIDRYTKHEWYSLADTGVKCGTVIFLVLFLWFRIEGRILPGLKSLCAEPSYLGEDYKVNPKGKK